MKFNKNMLFSSLLAVGLNVNATSMYQDPWLAGEYESRDQTISHTLTLNDIGTKAEIYKLKSLDDTPVTKFRLTLTEDNPSFSVKDEIIVSITHKAEEKQEFLRNVSCTRKKGGNKCSYGDIKNLQYIFKRSNSDGKFYLDVENSSPVIEFEYGIWNKEPYLDFSIYGASSFESYTQKGVDYYPTITITANNVKFTSDDPRSFGRNIDLYQLKEAGMQLRSAKDSAVSRDAIWNHVQVPAEAYLQDLPDIKPVLQVGVSLQTPGTSTNVALTTDFKDISVNVDPGASINADYELEVFASVFAAESMSDVTSGMTSTISGDFGMGLGVGGLLTFDSTNTPMGAGLTFGWAGFAEVDLSVNEALEIATTATTETSTNSSGSDNRRERETDGRHGGWNSREGRTHRNDGDHGRSIEN